MGQAPNCLGVNYKEFGFPDSSIGKKVHLQCRRPWFNSDSWVGKIRWRRDRLPTPVFLDFPCGSGSKESTCNAGDLGSIPGLGRSPGEGIKLPTPVFWLEEIPPGVAKSRTQLRDFHFTSLHIRN